MSLTPGTRLGPYEVLSSLGAGGMGEVYRASDTRLDRIVALKVLATHLAADPQLRERFEREARAISSLNHPNICVLHDIGQAEGIDFIVMEFLEGETLAARLARKPMRVDESLAVAIQIASALDRAHRQGIVHRDLKPANVMLTKSSASSSAPQVKLLDFGLARLARAGGPETRDGLGHGLVSLADLSMPTMSSPLTMKGTILGTLQYMSPEQLEGKDVDARADIFAFGALLYEMLTGRRPFEGKSQASLIGAILDHEPPRVTTIQPSVPPLLDEIVARCLAKDPENRWQTARDLMRQLEWTAVHGRAPSTTTDNAGAPAIARRGGWLRTSAVGVAAAAITGAALAWTLWLKAPAPSPVSRFAFELPDGQGFTRSGRRVLAISPDGQRLVYVANRRLYLRNLNELTAAPIAGTEEADPSEPIFSPDGQWVAFWSNGTIKKVPVTGGAPLLLSPATNPFGHSWHADRIVMGQGDNARNVIAVPAAGGHATTLVELDASKGERAQSPQLIGGGRAVLFTLRTDDKGWDDAAIVAQDLTSGRRTVLVNGGTDGRVLSTGHLIYVHDGTLFAIAFDETSLAVSGVAKPVQPGVEMATAGFSGAAQLAISDSGTFAFVPGRVSRDNSLLWSDRQGRVERPPVPNRRYQPGTPQMRVSPDGSKVALTILAEAGSGQAGAGQDIWVWDIARLALSRLSFTSGAAFPVWTPDSRRVCFQSGAVYCQAADGSGQPQEIFNAPGLIGLADVSPDGKWILMSVRDAQAGSAVAIAPLQPGAQVRSLISAGGNEANIDVSPDGRWIAYETSESGIAQIVVRPFPDVDQGRWQISTTGGVDPLWSHSGREVFFLDVATAGAARPSAIMSVAVAPGPRFVAGPPTVVMKYPPSATQGFAEGADGRFLFNVPASAADGEAVSRSQIVVVQNWVEELRAKVPNR
jgi:Tol biopolymer transport system component